MIKIFYFDNPQKHDPDANIHHSKMPYLIPEKNDNFHFFMEIPEF